MVMNRTSRHFGGTLGGHVLYAPTQGDQCLQARLSPLDRRRVRYSKASFFESPGERHPLPHAECARSLLRPSPVVVTDEREPGNPFCPITDDEAMGRVEGESTCSCGHITPMRAAQLTPDPLQFERARP